MYYNEIHPFFRSMVKDLFYWGMAGRLISVQLDLEYKQWVVEVEASQDHIVTHYYNV